jgi:hypothetical protein
MPAILITIAVKMMRRTILILSEDFIAHSYPFLDLVYTIIRFRSCLQLSYFKTFRINGAQMQNKTTSFTNRKIRFALLLAFLMALLFAIRFITILNSFIFFTPFFLALAITAIRTVPLFYHGSPGFCKCSA